MNIAKHCELHIITEGEFREAIENTLPTLPYGGNMHFYYNPVSEEIRRMCWNQGDWRFYKYYKDWQWKTYLMAKEICKSTEIDILHQLNMIGFREPGYLWKLSQETGIKFVWGPVGGLKQYPLNYSSGGGVKMRLFLMLKNTLNIIQLKYDRRVNKALKQAAYIISSIPDSYCALKKYKNIESRIIPETGCFTAETDKDIIHDFNSKELRVLWIGKFDFRKRLDIALNAIAACKRESVVMDIYGTGNDYQVAMYKRLAESLGVDARIKWMGNKSNQETLEAMRTAHLLLFTSVSEDTSTVIMEAISNKLPVVCFDTCGMSHVINENVGIKIPLTNPKKSVEDFAKVIATLYDDRKKLESLSENCTARSKELSWDNKAIMMVQIYKDVLGIK